MCFQLHQQSSACITVTPLVHIKTASHLAAPIKIIELKGRSTRHLVFYSDGYGVQIILSIFYYNAQKSLLKVRDFAPNIILRKYENKNLSLWLIDLNVLNM